MSGTCFRNDGVFCEDRKVCGTTGRYENDPVCHLTNTKCLADGSVLKKIDKKYSKNRFNRSFYVDGDKVDKIIRRLNFSGESKNWLSMK